MREERLKKIKDYKFSIPSKKENFENASSKFYNLLNNEEFI